VKLSGEGIPEERLPSTTTPVTVTGWENLTITKSCRLPAYHEE
jgi:hypothetical protein